MYPAPNGYSWKPGPDRWPKLTDHFELRRDSDDLFVGAVARDRSYEELATWADMEYARTVEGIQPDPTPYIAIIHVPVWLGSRRHLGRHINLYAATAKLALAVRTMERRAML